MISLEFNQVSFSYLNGDVLHNVSLTIKPGEMVGLLGPNGSGKTTLLKIASGVLKPVSGEVRHDGLTLSKLKRKVIARQVAVVPQQFSVPFAFTTTEVVMLGRIPFIKPFAGESPVDQEAVSRALDMVDINTLAKRRFDELSGGEQQKVVLAMALAQQPKMLLLDEPTVHLDITHQVEIPELVRSLNREQGITVVAAMHDLNLAALYFDRLTILKNGQLQADGPPIQVLTEEMIMKVFSASVKVEQHPITGAPHVVILPKEYPRKSP